LDHVTLTIGDGRFVALMGPSGRGKSKLLNILSGIDRADEGEVEVAGRHLTGLSEDELAAWRARHVGLVFQFYNLMPVLSARENVELPLLLSDLPKPERRRRAEVALDVVGSSAAASSKCRRRSPAASRSGLRSPGDRHRPRPDRRRRADRRSRRGRAPTGCLALLSS